MLCICVSVVQAHNTYERLKSLVLFHLIHERREMIMNVLLCGLQLRVSGVALPHLFVRWLAIQGSLESTGCFCSCHLRNSQTQSQQIDPHPATVTFFHGKPCNLKCPISQKRFDLPEGWQDWFSGVGCNSGWIAIVGNSNSVQFLISDGGAHSA